MNETMRKIASRLTLLAVGLYLIVGIGPAVGQSAVTNPDTYTYVRASEPRTMDPGNAIDNVSLVVLADIYQRLVTLNRDDPSQIVGDVANTWTVSDDGLVYTFELRRGIRFQDGTPLTAEDVKFSFDRIILMNGSAGLARELELVRGAAAYLDSDMGQADADSYLAADGVQALDDHTVRVTLTDPFPAFLPKLALLSFIVSKDFVEANGGLVPGEENEFMSRNAMGSGPFAFVQWVPGQRIVLERYNGYWKGPAALGRVIVEFVAETGTRLLRLQTGDVDYIELSPAQADQVLNLDTGQSKVDGVFVQMNPRFAGNFIFFNTQFEPFDNPTFREAMFHAFPYDVYIEESLRGIFGNRANGPIPQGMFGFPEDRPFPEQDLARSRALFEQAGWQGTLTMTIRAGRATNEQVALLLKDAVEGLDVGIDIELQEFASSTFVSMMRAGELALYPNSWGANFNDPDTMVTNLYHSNGFYPVQQGFGDPTLDQMIEAARSQTDLAAREQMYHDIVARGENQFLHIVTDQPFVVNPIRTWLKGWRANPLLWSKESYFLAKSAAD